MGGFWSFRPRNCLPGSPASPLEPLTLVTASALPAHSTDTAPVPSQPLLAQPVGTGTH